MKRPFLFGLSLLVLGLTWTSCSNKLDVIGKWKEIPVVYGILNSNDTAQYISIQRAYLPENTDALQVAQNPDSIYFAASDITVLMYQNGTFFDTLRRVDANLEGHTKDSGIFVQSPNYAYKTRKALVPNNLYRLDIQSHKTGLVYTASAEAITNVDFTIVSPATSRPVKWSYDNNGTYAMNEVRFDWHEPENADIYDMSILLYYYEYQVDDQGVEVPNSRQSKSITWKPVQNFVPENNVQQNITGDKFYTFLANNLSSAEGTRTRRCARKMDIMVDAGGYDLMQYIKNRRANENLIGGLYPTDPYSNISNGGYGVFSSTLRTVKPDIRLDVEVFDYLAHGDITNKLGFESFGCN